MRRVMLKLSGESLSGDEKYGFNDNTIKKIAKVIKDSLNEKVQIAIVIGGGNFYRGRTSTDIDRYKADGVGMLATCMNAIYFSEFLKNESISSSIYGAFEINGFIKQFNKDDAINDLNNKKIVLLSGGTGHPYFTTDTGVALRAIELECTEILMAKAIDYIYDKDPNVYNDAKKYDTIFIQEVIDKKLNAIDLTAAILLLENKIPCTFFLGKDINNIKKAIDGTVCGTRLII
ncbi:MAG: UMP kinase [Eubacteriales bacterium]|nr:UMP kinase [Eubacteriales bacterium]